MSCNISVIIPVHNGEDTIVRALESCIDQTHLPEEVVVIDDGSTDQTSMLVQRWQKEYAGPVAMIYRRLEENRGPSAARNSGWDISSGKYISFLDADDYFLPKKIEHIYISLKAKPDIILIAHNHSIKNDEECQNNGIIYKLDKKDILIKNRFATPAVTVQRSIPERFDETMRFTEDHDLWLRLTAKYNESYFMEKVLTIVDRPVNSIGGQSGHLWEMRKGEMYMYHKYCKDNGKIMLLPFLLTFSMSKHILKRLKGYL